MEGETVKKSILFAALLVLGCGIKLPDIPFPLPSPTPSVSPSPVSCIPNAAGVVPPPCEPSPSPTAVPTPTPVPSPTPLPNACEDIVCPAGTECYQAGPGEYGCRPIIGPPPTPKPPKPCKIVEADLPCWTCSARLAYDVAHGHLTWDATLKLYFNDPPGKPREYFDRACNKTDAAGRVQRTRYEWFGEYPAHENGLCPVSMLTCPSPSPSASPTPQPSPGATPQPGPTPATCPMLVRWGGGLHAQMTPQFQGIPKTPTFAGNTIDFDSTARFGNGGRGLPCNDEHHAVCEKDGIDDGPNWRRCEDPRGPIFTVTRGGGEKVSVINGGWGLRIKGVHAGEVCVRIEPRPDVQDAEGQPVRVGPNPATEACITVE